MKRIISTLLYSALAVVASVSASAHDYAGWTAYPVFADGNQKVINTGKTIFYCNSGLFSYDTEEQEQRAFYLENGMSRNTIDNMFYNPEERYLLTTASSGEIDLVYLDGQIKNLRDIADAEISNPKINDVCFSDGNIYVATAFGLVKLDGETGDVIESGIFDKNVTAIAMMNDKLLIVTGGYLYSMDKNKSIRHLENFDRQFTLNNTEEIRAVNDHLLLTRGSAAGGDALRLIDYNTQTGQVTSNRTLYNKKTQYFIDTPDGNFYFVMDGKIYTFEGDTMVEKLTIPEGYETDVIGASDGLQTLWTLNVHGITNIAPMGTGAQVLTDRFCYPATYTRDIMTLEPSADGSKLLLSNLTFTTYKLVPKVLFNPATVTLFDLDNERFNGANPFPIEASGAPGKAQQNTYGKYILTPANVAYFSDEPDIVYVCSAYDGIFKVDTKTQECVGRYNNDNTPLVNSWGGVNTVGCHIDKYGNMWVATMGPDVLILPADKRKLPTDQIKHEDWQKLNIPEFAGSFDMRIVETKKDVIYIIHNAAMDYAYVAIDMNGTPSNYADDKVFLARYFIDQDGKDYTPTRNASIVEDNNGRIWFGSDAGVFMISDPMNLDANGAVKVNRVKVPRNDGTNEADYLLGKDMVLYISPDSHNRKWIVGESTGLVCTTASGNEILQTFDSSNSPLPGSRKVASVWVDQRNDRVYVGTTEGLFSYDASESGSAEDYSDIYAYPNPVRPEYQGTIYIKGLMDNSLVKIADASGNVVAQGRSENGMYQWNGLTFSGSRVKSGVYYVFASQNSNGTSAAVAKILVIN